MYLFHMFFFFNNMFSSNLSPNVIEHQQCGGSTVRRWLLGAKLPTAKWPIRDHPPTHPNASLFLFVAIFQLEHETHGKDSVLQWSHSAMEMLKKHTLIFYPSSFQNVNYEFCELYLGGERKQGLQGPGNKGRRGHRLGK